MEHDVDTLSNKILTLTTAAQKHFQSLVAAENEPGMNLKISVLNPGTSRADVGIVYCPKGEEKDSDIAIDYDSFTLFIEKSSEDALNEAVIDYQSDDQLGGKLCVKAPRIKGSTPNSDAPLIEKVEHFINTEINPNLSSHGGFITLVNIDENGIVFLRFGGGCQGCGMADATLKSFVEKSLCEAYPEIKGVADATNHAQGENPYYS